MSATRPFALPAAALRIIDHDRAELSEVSHPSACRIILNPAPQRRAAKPTGANFDPPSLI
ncbi:hypothetical protein CAF53_12005 [Sphingobium sp. LB126]|nr:hypothetical protein CAF53_12005 [Sphingobium sp. LB126]